MPTIVIKNGDRSLKLTKTERGVLTKAIAILADISADYQPLSSPAANAIEAIENIGRALDVQATDKLVTSAT